MANLSTKLYLVPGSSSLFPHILLRYCNVPFTPQVVELSTLSDLDGVNTKRQVPVLVHNGNIITENGAIAHTINQLAPEKHVFGHTLLEFVRVCEWLSWIAGPLHAQAWGPFIRPWRFTADSSDKAQAAVKEAAEQRVLDCFARLEDNLDADGPWAMGKSFTAVDAYVFPFFFLARDRMGISMDPYPRWNRGVQEAMKLGAVKEALEFEDSCKKNAGKP